MGNEVKERKRKEFLCNKCCYKCSDKFSTKEKHEIFYAFWEIGETDKRQDRQRQYVANYVVEVTPERNRAIPSRKKRSLNYYLEKGNERERVCHSFFLSVLGISEKFVRVCISKKNDSGVVSPDRRGKKTSKNKTPAWIEEHAHHQYPK